MSIVPVTGSCDRWRLSVVSELTSKPRRSSSLTILLSLRNASSQLLKPAASRHENTSDLPQTTAEMLQCRRQIVLDTEMLVSASVSRLWFRPQTRSQDRMSRHGPKATISASTSIWISHIGWSRGQSIGLSLGLGNSVSISRFWPRSQFRSQEFGLSLGLKGLPSISVSRVFPQS